MPTGPRFAGTSHCPLPSFPHATTVPSRRSPRLCQDPAEIAHRFVTLTVTFSSLSPLSPASNSGTTPNVATELVTEPYALLTTSEYPPALLSNGAGKVKEAVVAPGTPTPLKSH